MVEKLRPALESRCQMHGVERADDGAVMAHSVTLHVMISACESKIAGFRIGRKQHKNVKLNASEASFCIHL
jgi:hypothetical protein